MKKFIFCLILSLILCSSCSYNKKELINPIDFIDNDSQVSGEGEYTNFFSKCYENKDGTKSLYIFSSPIAYEENGEFKAIDNTIIKCKKQEYAYENKSNDIKMYFPYSLKDKFKITYKEDYFEFKLHEDIKGFSKAKLVNFKNMYGDYVEAVKYKGKEAELYFYCSSAGIKCEINCKNAYYLKELNFKVYNLDLSANTDMRDLVVFKDHHNNEVKNIIRKPYEQKNGKIIYGKEIQVLKLNDCYRLTFSAEDSLKMDLSFEMYKDKMFDGFNDKNYKYATYLDNICTLSEDCTLFIQNQLEKYSNIDNKNIQKVYFYFRNFSDSDMKMDFYKISEIWSTVLTTVNPPEKLEFCLTENIKSNSYNKIDLTKMFFKNGEKITDTYGIAVKTKNNCSVSVSDNYQYPYYYELIYKN